MVKSIYFRSICLIVLLFSTLLFAAACGRSEPVPTREANPMASAEPRPVEVTIAEAISQQVPVFIQVTGSFVADESSDVTPQTSGQVMATPIEVGAFVDQGEVVARLDDRDAKLRLQQARAVEQQAAAAVRQAESKLGLKTGKRFDAAAVPEVQSARAAYESAQAEAKLAETNARRYTKLFEPGYVSQSAYDQALTQAETARAKADAARQQYEAALNAAQQSHQGIAVAQASLEEARAQVAMAQKAVEDTVIRAPFSGYVSARHIAIGESVTPASKIVTIQRIRPIKLQVQVSEAEAARVQMGMPVSTRVAAYPDREFHGTVTAINPAIDPASRAMTVEVKIDNSDNTLRPGMFATARIVQPTGERAVFLPSAALLTDASTNSARVFVLEGNTARVRVVQPGEREGDKVRILSGLSEGETVATGNLAQLYDGAIVQYPSSAGEVSGIGNLAQLDAARAPYKP